MRRLTRAATSVVLVLAAASVLALTGSGCKRSNFVVRPYLVDPGQTRMTVSWVTAKPCEPVLLYGAGAAPDREHPTTCREFDYHPYGTRTAPTRGPKNTYYAYRGILTDLSPGAEYCYSVRIGKEVVAGRFRTSPAAPEPFTFVAYGDSRTGVREHVAVARQIRAADPAFVLHSGDLTDSGAFVQYPPQFFGPLKDVIDHVPVWTALGNHDGFWSTYRALFPMPGNGQWYSFDYANAHFAVLDSGTGPIKQEYMLAWLEQDLAASRADWKVVCYHHPSYDLARRHTAWGRAEFVPVFRKYGVDLVLTGHSHGYQRFKPMFMPGENDAHPITHMVAAGGGAPLTSLESSSYLARGAKAFNLVVFRIDGAKLAARVLGRDGELIDEFTVDKTGGRLSADYLASALPEDEFDKLRDLLVTQLRGLRLPAIPQPGEPVTFSFPVTAGDAPLKLKFFVENTDDYALDPASVRCPANQTARVTLTLKARTAVGLRGGALDPPVALECHYECGKQKGVVIGGKLGFGLAAAPTTAPEPAMER